MEEFHPQNGKEVVYDDQEECYTEIILWEEYKFKSAGEVILWSHDCHVILCNASVESPDQTWSEHHQSVHNVSVASLQPHQPAQREARVKETNTHHAQQALQVVYYTGS